MRADSIFFFPEYACSFEKSGFCFLLRAVFVALLLQRGFFDKASALLSGACVRLHNHSGTVFPTMQQITRQVCRICWRCCWGGCSVVIRNCLLHSLGCKPKLSQGLLQTVQWFSSIELLLCCNLLLSTSTQHVLVSILFQVIAYSQTSPSLFHLVWEE